MRVNVVCAGRFLSFQLAGQLKRLGCLGRHYTCTPIFTGHVPLGRYGLSRRDVRTLPGAEVLRRLASRLGRRGRMAGDRLKTRWFQRWVERNLEPCDVVHAWAGSALRVFRSSGMNGEVRVLDRSIAHRRVAAEMMREEFTRYGARFRDNRHGMEMELREYDAADAIVVPSGFVERSFLREGVPAAKLHRVPFGSLQLRDPLPPRQQGRFRVLYVGALSVRKGFRYLLEAVSMLGDLRELELQVVGPRPEPPVAPHFRKHRKLFRYEGYVPKPRLYERIYPRASVLVQPSVLEGMSFVLMEALAHGVPVVATANTGAGDVITHGEEGYIVPIRDPDAIAHRLRFLYEHPDLLEQMSRRALRKARDALSWDKYGERMTGVYRELLGGNQREAV